MLWYLSGVTYSWTEQNTVKAGSGKELSKTRERLVDTKSTTAELKNILESAQKY